MSDLPFPQFVPASSGLLSTFPSKTPLTNSPTFFSVLSVALPLRGGGGRYGNIQRGSVQNISSEAGRSMFGGLFLVHPGGEFGLGFD